MVIVLILTQYSFDTATKKIFPTKKASLKWLNQREK